MKKGDFLKNRTEQSFIRIKNDYSIYYRKMSALGVKNYVWWDKPQI